MSLEKTFIYLLQIAGLLIALHGPLHTEPDTPVRVALPLLVCPR